MPKQSTRKRVVQDAMTSAPALTRRAKLSELCRRPTATIEDAVSTFGVVGGA